MKPIKETLQSGLEAITGRHKPVFLIVRNESDKNYDSASRDNLAIFGRYVAGDYMRGRGIDIDIHFFASPPFIDRGTKQIIYPYGLVAEYKPGQTRESLQAALSQVRAKLDSSEDQVGMRVRGGGDDASYNQIMSEFKSGLDSVISQLGKKK